jgi:hypothetical protein
MKTKIIHGTTKCTNRIKDKSGFFDTKTCKTKLHNLRTICSYKRKIKPPFKKGWVKQYSLCNTKILKPVDTPKLKCNYSFDKKGKTVKVICKSKINNKNEICTYTRKTILPQDYELGVHKVPSLCKTTVLKKGKPLHFPSDLKCKRIPDKTGKFTKQICKNKTDTIMRECKFNTRKTQWGTLKVKCTRPKSTRKRKQSKRKPLRGGTVNPISEIGSMFGTLGSSLQSVVSSLTVPNTLAFNPPLPINAAPSSQYLSPPLTQSISSIFKSI